MKVILFMSFFICNSLFATDKEFKNSLGSDFILINLGEFKMGSNANYSFDNEKPEHNVKITKSFYLAKYEVTQEEWIKVMGKSAYENKRSNPFYSLPGMANRITKPKNPVTVSWNEANEFVKKLNEIEKTSKYRLPTEAEWEYAAKAGTISKYSFGDDESKLKEHAWYGEGFTLGGTHTIGTKKPNPWGLYDIHGNVWEWVSDFYSDSYFKNSPEIDPKGPESSSGHVVKGGSWHETSSGWHTTMRKEYDPDYRGISIGFRLLREL